MEENKINQLLVKLQNIPKNLTEKQRTHYITSNFTTEELELLLVIQLTEKHKFF